jgi:hypothetical protein
MEDAARIDKKIKSDFFMGESISLRPKGLQLNTQRLQHHQKELRVHCGCFYRCISRLEVLSRQEYGKLQSPKGEATGGKCLPPKKRPLSNMGKKEEEGKIAAHKEHRPPHLKRNGLDLGRSIAFEPTESRCNERPRKI